MERRSSKKHYIHVFSLFLFSTLSQHRFNWHWQMRALLARACVCERANNFTWWLINVFSLRNRVVEMLLNECLCDTPMYWSPVCMYGLDDWKYVLFLRTNVFFVFLYFFLQFAGCLHSSIVCFLLHFHSLWYRLTLSAWFCSHSLWCFYSILLDSTLILLFIIVCFAYAYSLLSFSVCICFLNCITALASKEKVHQCLMNIFIGIFLFLCLKAFNFCGWLVQSLWLIHYFCLHFQIFVRLERVEVDSLWTKTANFSIWKSVSIPLEVSRS